MEAQENKWLAFDCEATGLSTFHGSKPFMFTTYDGKESRVYYPDQYHELAKILADPTIRKIGQNVKFDILHAQAVGLTVSTPVHDTMVMSFLYDERTKHNLEFLSEHYLSKRKLANEVKEWLSKHGYTKERQQAEKRSFYELVPKEIMESYAVMDTILTYELAEYFLPKLIDMNLIDLYEQEMELIPVLVDMQTKGLRIDVPYFEALYQEYEQKVKEYRQTLLKTINISDFNLNSTIQLGRWLKESKGIILPATEKGQDSVDKAALAPYLDYPDIRMLLDYRFATKMLNTYIGPYLQEHVNGVLHANLNQCGARSGRMSSSEPNLQTVPKPDEEKPETIIIRKGFIPREGMVNVYLDFSNMEVVVFVDYAEDPKMIKTLLSGLDFHQQNANELGLPGKSGRKKAKTFVFALLYGAGVAKIAKQIGVSTEEAQKLKNAFFSHFSQVGRFVKGVQATCKKRGFVFNRYKRRQRLGSEKAYVGVNRLVQGTCADLVKEKMIKLSRLIKGTTVNLLFQIHDELVFEMLPEDMPIYIPKIKEEMEDLAHVLKHLPLKVEAEYSTTNWADKEKWHA